MANIGRAKSFYLPTTSAINEYLSRDSSGHLVKTAETAFDPWGVRLNGVGSVNGFQNRWEMQNHEKESTFGLNRVNFGARTVNPTNGRFDRIDPMSEAREWLTPYNMVQNNPVNRIDPDGAFDTKAQAKAYAKENDIYTGWFGRNKVQQGSDGSWAINNRNEGTSISNDADFGVMKAAVVTAEAPLSFIQWNGEFNDPLVRWSNSEGFASKFSYNLINDAYLTLQGFDFDLLGNDHVNPITGKRAFTNIDGTANYKPIEGLVNTLTFAIPTAKVPAGLGYIKTLNASSFSKMFKGSFVTKLSPKYRGTLNRVYNTGTDWLNSQISSGKAALKLKGVFPKTKDTNIKKD